MKVRCIASLLVILLVFNCKEKLTITPIKLLQNDLENQISAIDGDVALAFLDLSNPSDTIFIHIDEQYHAASTMKVPVMIELFKQQAQGHFNLNDTIVLKNEFKSIVDKSPYQMDIADDSDDIIYNKIGTNVTLYELMVPMITVSSNLATNVLIEIVDAKKVTQTMRDLGANNIQVLRGVEDIKAYEQGLSNSTTARDLLVIMKAIAEGNAGNEQDTKAMLDILKAQEWNDMIPKYLPKDLEIAHKTGSITGVHHDAAVVYLPDGNSYILVLLSKNLADFEKGTDQLARISEDIFNYIVNKPK